MTVYLVGLASGTATLAIDEATGTAHMDLVETKYTFVATTSAGGEGSSSNAALERYDLD